VRACDRYMHVCLPPCLPACLLCMCPAHCVGGWIDGQMFMKNWALPSASLWCAPPHAPTQSPTLPQSWMMLAMVPFRIPAATKTPGLMGLMAKSVVHEDQGVLQGSIMSLRVLAKVCVN
jgi:hypothetical protein